MHFDCSVMLRLWVRHRKTQPSVSFQQSISRHGIAQTWVWLCPWLNEIVLLSFTYFYHEQVCNPPQHGRKTHPHRHVDLYLSDAIFLQPSARRHRMGARHWPFYFFAGAVCLFLYQLLLAHSCLLSRKASSTFCVDQCGVLILDVHNF